MGRMLSEKGGNDEVGNLDIVAQYVAVAGADLGSWSVAHSNKKKPKRRLQARLNTVHGCAPSGMSSNSCPLKVSLAQSGHSCPNLHSF